MEWYIKAMRHYSDFAGRSTRVEFWMFLTFQIILSIGIVIIDNAIGTAIPELGSGFLYIFFF